MEQERCHIAVTQKDIADHLGISRSAVAQVLNGIGHLNSETREKVLQAARELGYRPNPMARALLSGKTNTVAFWFYPMLDPFSMAMVNTLQMMVPPYSLTVNNLGLFKPSPGSHAAEFPPAEWPVDGILAYCTGSLPDHLLKGGSNATPLVYITTDLLEVDTEHVDTVLVNMQHGSEAAVRHLVATRKRVAMLCLPPVSVENGDGRALAYEAVMREAGRQPEHILVPLRRPYRARAREAFLEYVQAHGCPDAIFCASDEQATAVNFALHEIGRSVPEDVAIVGFDNLEETEYHIPPLSTIEQPREEMCAVAWEKSQEWCWWRGCRCRAYSHCRQRSPHPYQ